MNDIYKLLNKEEKRIIRRKIEDNNLNFDKSILVINEGENTSIYPITIMYNNETYSTGLCINHNKELVCIEMNSRFKSNEYTCRLTKEMDKYLIYPFKQFNTYIYGSKLDNCYILRYPGATRGKIVVNDNDIIQDIVLYSDCDIYNKEVKEIFNKYIGKKMSFRCMEYK